MKRTHNCGELTQGDIGKSVVLAGWVHRRRDHGGLIFIDLRDRYGITQIVFNPAKSGQIHDAAGDLRSEYVIAVEGRVEKRPEGTENPNLKTGGIEISAEKLSVLNPSLTPPFEIDEETQVAEELRFQYRFLDLRRRSCLEKFLVRHRACQAVRNFLDGENFIEVETPILTKSTPEGARDYLVPSRLNPGKFYALPQSPQLFKQILMVSGFERYFQIARCFRDEDLRADRQPEFTQLDIEMSFVDEEEIFGIAERLIKELFKKAIGADIRIPFPRLKYSEAMERFGTDKPDTRFGMELAELSDVLKGSGFKVFEDAVSRQGGAIKGINVSQKADMSRGEIDDLTQLAVRFGAKGLAYLKVTGAAAESPIAKYFKGEQLEAAVKRLAAKRGDMIFLVADKREVVNEALSQLRLAIAERLGLIKKGIFEFLWVTEFPLFKYNEEEKRWESEHHPFTAPFPDDIPFLESEPKRVRARAYDLVLNGVEVGSGSIRIHDRATQARIFKMIGIDEEEARKRFGFLLDAFMYGAPPHGGIAPGLDRLIAMMTDSASIREVIAFPKTQKAACFLTAAPSEVSERQLKELGLTLKK